MEHLLFFFLMLIVIIINNVILYFTIKKSIDKANANLYRGLCKELDAQNCWMNPIISSIQDKVKNK